MGINVCEDIAVFCRARKDILLPALTIHRVLEEEIVYRLANKSQRRDDILRLDWKIGAAGRTIFEQ
jgi:hypothetical protein